MRGRACFIALFVTGLGLTGVGPAVAEPVDLELVLAADVSGSMDADERALQRNGYGAALAHAAVVNAIRGGYRGRIAITYVEWAGPDSQVMAAPWAAVHDMPSARAFADAVMSAPMPWIHGTSISGALVFAAGLFDDNGFEGTRRVIDISGDGANNRGEPVEAARDRVVARGIAINGLPLLIRPSLSGGFGLDAYYRDCVIGGAGAFVVPVQDIRNLARALRRKLIVEIAGRPPRVIPAAFRPVRAKTDCLIGERMWGLRLREQE